MESLSLYFHEFGVNMRHLGLVGLLCSGTCFSVRKRITTEIVVRALKRVMRIE
jgi:hypothetical protein